MSNNLSTNNLKKNYLLLAGLKENVYKYVHVFLRVVALGQQILYLDTFTFWITSESTFKTYKN